MGMEVLELTGILLLEAKSCGASSAMGRGKASKMLSAEDVDSSLKGKTSS
jgi:hypothetical protein